MICCFRGPDRASLKVIVIVKKGNMLSVCEMNRSPDLARSYSLSFSKGRVASHLIELRILVVFLCILFIRHAFKPVVSETRLTERTSMTFLPHKIVKGSRSRHSLRTRVSFCTSI